VVHICGVQGTAGSGVVAEVAEDDEDVLESVVRELSELGEEDVEV